MQEETYTIIVNNKITMIVMPLNFLPVLLCAHDRMDVVSNTIQARVFK